jgi:hypothetical protein
MTSHRSDIPSVSDICAHVEHLGYATSRHISAITEQEKASMEKSKEKSTDQDRGKGSRGAVWVESGVRRRSPWTAIIPPGGSEPTVN